MVVERPTSKVFVSILQVGESTATHHGCTAKMECNATVAAMQRGKRSIEHRAETNAGRWKCIASESVPPIDFSWRENWRIKRRVCTTHAAEYTRYSWQSRHLTLKLTIQSVASPPQTSTTPTNNVGICEQLLLFIQNLFH